MLKGMAERSSHSLLPSAPEPATEAQQSGSDGLHISLDLEDLAGGVAEADEEWEDVEQPGAGGPSSSQQSPQVHSIPDYTEEKTREPKPKETVLRACNS